MMPDRVVSHVKRSFGTNDIYLPQEMIERMSSVLTVDGEFLDHNDPTRLLFAGWDTVSKQHFIPIPSIDNGYTKNHFYEFADGQVSIRHIVGSDIKYVHNYVAEGLGKIIKKAIISSIFGNVCLQKATVEDIILTRHPVGDFPKKSKVSSLAEKYFSIPEDKLYYYPKLSDLQAERTAIENSNLRAMDDVDIVKRKRGVDNIPVVQPKNQTKLGRKKAVVAVIPFSQSILRFVKILQPETILKLPAVCSQLSDESPIMLRYTLFQLMKPNMMSPLLTLTSLLNIQPRKQAY